MIIVGMAGLTQCTCEKRRFTYNISISIGAIQVLHNVVGVCQIFRGKGSRICTFQCYREGVGGCQISRKKLYVTLEWANLLFSYFMQFHMKFHRSEQNGSEVSGNNL